MPNGTGDENLKWAGSKTASGARKFRVRNAKTGRVMKRGSGRVKKAFQKVYAAQTAADFAASAKYARAKGQKRSNISRVATMRRKQRKAA